MTGTRAWSSPVKLMLSLAMAGLLIAGTSRTTSAEPQQTGDQVEMAGVSTLPLSPPGTVGFHLDLRYRLRSAQRGFLVIFDPLTDPRFAPIDPP